MMTHPKVRPLFAFVGACLCLGVGSAKADLIVNGSFESPNMGSGSAIYSSIPGWTSNNNEVEIGNGNVYGLPAYSGTAIAELNGNTYDTISQTVTGLVVGQKYQLTWAYAGRANSGAQQMNVFFNNVQVGQNSAMNATSWSANSAIVTATATSQVLSFAAVNVGSGNASVGNLLDAVTLNAVAEPASLLIVGAGLAGLFVRRRKRHMSLPG